MPTTLDPVAKVAANLDGVAKSTVGQYREVVAALAGSEDVDPEVIHHAIVAAGKSVDQLRADIDKVKGRLNAAEGMGDAEQLSVEREEAAGEHAKLASEAAAVRAECNARMKEADDRAAAARVRERELYDRSRRLSREGREVLTATCDPALVERHRLLGKERAEVIGQANTLRAKIGEDEARVRIHDLAAAKMLGNEMKNVNVSREEYRAALTEVGPTAARLPMRKDQLARLEARAEELSHEIEALRRQQLDPLAGW